MGEVQSSAARAARPQPTDAPGEQDSTPYLDALVAYAARRPGRYHVPGHKGGPGADPAVLAALGERAFDLDIPALTPGVDVGPSPTPFERAQAMAARAWGARRSWFLLNGASQGSHAACLALAHSGPRLVVQRNVHSSTVDGLVLSGLEPTWVAPEVDLELGVAHCLTPAALDEALAATPGAAGALAVSPTYFGAVADVRGLAEVAHRHGLPLVIDEAWGAHLAFHPDLPEDALSAGADLVISSTHKLVGALTQSAMLHLGRASEGRVDQHVVDRAVTLVESTSPSALLSGSLDGARRLAAVHGRERLETAIAVLREARREVASLPGLAVIDERLSGEYGVAGIDPLRLGIDVRGTGLTGFELERRLLETANVVLELSSANVVVAVFGMGEPLQAAADRLLEGLRTVLAAAPPIGPGAAPRAVAPTPPWGPLVLSPRAAFLGPQQVVPVDEAVGRVAAESLAAFPPGIPNVLPGERLTAETLAYVQTTLEQGGALRGASDRTLHTVRVVREGS